MSGAALAITAGVELAKLALQIYFISMQTAGKSAEEMEAFYRAQRDYFAAHPPETLPEV